MRQILSIVLLLIGCSPDLDEVILDVEEVPLPAKLELNEAKQKKCQACVMTQCSERGAERYRDNKCVKLLEAKSKESSPEHLASLNVMTPSKDPENDKAQKTYQDYFDCVFLLRSTGDPNGCQDECNGGKNFSCKIDESDGSKKIELTIHIHQIKDMFAEQRMASPGWHDVVVQWVASTCNGYLPYPPRFSGRIRTGIKSDNVELMQPTFRDNQPGC